LFRAVEKGKTSTTTEIDEPEGEKIDQRDLADYFKMERK
jgi:hypothetical protein